MPLCSLNVTKKGSTRNELCTVPREFELESSLIKKTIATSLIPESDLVEEGQDSKTPVETEPRGVRTTETKISRLSATFSFSKEAKLLCLREKLHAT